MQQPTQKRNIKPPVTTKLKQEKEQPLDLNAVARDDRTHKVAGFIFLTLSLLLFLALVSYCFTWKQDQDKVFAAGADFLFVEQLKVDNLLGRIGAWIGFKLIHQGFGLGSFLFCTLFFIVGINLLFGKQIFSVFRNLKYVITGSLFFSVAFAFILPNAAFSFGGAIGEYCSNYLSSLLGNTGAAIVIFGALATWLIWRFNPQFNAGTFAKKKNQQSRSANYSQPELEAQESAPNATQEIPLSDPESTPIAGPSVNDLYAHHSQQWQPKPLIDEPVAKNSTQSTGNTLNSEAGSYTSFPKMAASPTMVKDPALEIGMTEMEEEPNDLISIIPPTQPTVPPLEPERITPVPLPIETAEKEVVPNKKITPIAVRTVSSEELTGKSLPLEIKDTLLSDPTSEVLEEEPVVAPVAKMSMDQLSEMEPYDPAAELKGYRFPTIDLLDTHGSEKVVADPQELEDNKNQIINTLSHYDIAIQRISATVGPTVTLYEIIPAPGVRISRIKNLEDDIALSLAALGIRIIAPIPGKGTIGIEVPNVKKSIVSMRGLISSDKYINNKFSLPVAIGKTISNDHFVVDLAGMPHLLMAGATGQGKSVGINAVLVSLLYKKHPSQLKLVLVDPKKVELSLYRAIEKHFLAKLPGEEEAIITDTKKVVNTLNALCIEMDNRYDLLKEAGVRNIKEYNEKFIRRRLNPQKGHQYLPFIVLVVDEFADLIMTAGKEIEMPIARLAQLARAVGIHLIIATQRPSVNIITGTIKANFPSRVAFKVSSKIDSRTILDAGGAEQLIGKGDMLISHGGELIRLQCAFVDTPEVERICEFIGEQRGYSDAFLLPEYVDEKEQEARDFDLNDRDSLFDEAARLIVQNQVGSTSLLQRRMKLGYNRAGRLMDQLEQAGIVGPNLGSKARDVLIKTDSELNEILGQW